MQKDEWWQDLVQQLRSCLGCLYSSIKVLGFQSWLFFKLKFLLMCVLRGHRQRLKYCSPYNPMWEPGNAVQVSRLGMTQPRLLQTFGEVNQQMEYVFAHLCLPPSLPVSERERERARASQRERAFLSAFLSSICFKGIGEKEKKGRGNESTGWAEEDHLSQ